MDKCQIICRNVKEMSKKSFEMTYNFQNISSRFVATSIYSESESIVISKLTETPNIIMVPRKC